MQEFKKALNGELDNVVRAGYEKSPDKAKLNRLAGNLRARGAVSYLDVQAAQERERKKTDAATARVTAPYSDYLEAIKNGQSARAARLLAQSDKAYNAGKTKYFPNYDPRSYMAYQMARNLADSIEAERQTGVRNSPQQAQWLKQLNRLAPIADADATKLLASAKSAIYSNEIGKVARELSSEVSAGRENGDKALALRKRVEELRVFVDTNNSSGVLWNLDNAYASLANRLGFQYLNALEQGETAKADALLKRINANIDLANFYNTDSWPRQIELKSVLARGWSDIRSDASADLAKEIAAKRENSPAAIEARKRIEKADANNAAEYGTRGYSSILAPSFAWKGRAHETAYLLVKARQNGDVETVRKLEAQLQTEVENANAKIPNVTFSRDEVSLDTYIEWEKSRIKRGAPIITSENYVLRPGDPLISVAAPANCQKVLAILPSGEILPLVYDAGKRAWEARFDVPTYALEGAYNIQIVIIGADGTRQQLTMVFRVDTSAPAGKGGAVFGADGLNLQLQTDEQTDRVSAFTPWGERVELRRDANGIFVARADVPKDWQSKAAIIRFVLTDKAHNRTEIEVDWSR